MKGAILVYLYPISPFVITFVDRILSLKNLNTDEGNRLVDISLMLPMKFFLVILQSEDVL